MTKLSIQGAQIELMGRQFCSWVLGVDLKLRVKVDWCGNNRAPQPRPHWR